MGWVAACLLLGMLLPFMGMLYMDVLVVKHEVTEQIQKLEKLRKQIEQEKLKNDKT
jgi:hypothetical protein